MQNYERSTSDPTQLNSTDLRRRLEQVSRPLISEESEKKVEKEPAGDKLRRDTSESILEPLTEKLDDIAEKIEKERIEAEAMREKSQRELEEVKVTHHLL